jgi:hypothetical protein
MRVTPELHDQHFFVKRAGRQDRQAGSRGTPLFWRWW